MGLPFKLDWSIKTAEERAAYIKEKTELYPIPQSDTAALETCSNYILDGLSHEEKKSHYITSDNRQQTINRRETSFEGLMAKFESGEDGVYQLMSHLGKAEYLSPKQRIDPREAVKIPELRQLREAISQVEDLERTATGRDRLMLKQQLIEMRQEQYIIRNELKPPITVKSYYRTETLPSPTVGEEDVQWDGTVTSTAQVTLLNPEHVAMIIKKYDELRRAVESQPDSEVAELLNELNAVIEGPLKEHHMPWYHTVKLRMKKLTNAEISVELYKLYGDPIVFPEAIAETLRHAIPKAISKYEKERICVRYYKARPKLPWRVCTKCKKILPANLLFFASNATRENPYALYSMCKECRSNAGKKFPGTTRFERSRAGTFNLTEEEVRQFLWDHSHRYYPSKDNSEGGRKTTKPLVKVRYNDEGKIEIIEDLRNQQKEVKVENNGNNIENNMSKVQENVSSK